jgi:glycosyltransferase involved in cell wall biosynthesis
MIFYSNYSRSQKPLVGFRVITYNRCDALIKCVESICSNISAPFDLIIADDGSNDLTKKTCQQRGWPIIGKENRGIAWNKNRALYSLMSLSLADYIFLIEDDCILTEPNFLGTWLTALDLFGHINLIHPSTQDALNKNPPPPEILGGNGQGDNPYACIKISGTLIASTRDAINRIGYFDTRFSGYGHEHAEWTTRFRRAGY